MAVQIQVLNCPECDMKLAAARKAKQGRFQLELMPDTHFDEIRQTLTCPDCQKAFDVKTQLPPPHLAIVIKGARPTTPILTSDANIHAGSSITLDTGENEKQEQGAKAMSSDPGIAVVRRNTEEVQSRGNFEVFEELFASDFVDHTPQPGGFTPDRDGARNLYRALRAAFPDFHAEIHWQISDGDRVTTYKTYHGTHQGTFQGLAPTGRKVHFETVDVMRVRNGKITEHWGVANLFSLMQQLGVAPSWGDTKAGATS